MTGCQRTVSDNRIVIGAPFSLDKEPILCPFESALAVRIGKLWGLYCEQHALEAVKAMVHQNGSAFVTDLVNAEAIKTPEDLQAFMEAADWR